MIDDFKPAAARPAKSLRTALEERTEVKTNTETETFQTPEEVAAHEFNAEQVSAQAIPSAVDDSTLHNRTNRSVWRRFALRWPPTKKEWIALGVGVVLVFGGLSAFALTRHKSPVVAAVPKTTYVKKAVAPIVTTVASNLSGLPVDPSLNKLPVTGVMIENSTDARPQSGLGSAGVVFEAIAEGGITRFLALFQDTSPANVGPIRSARPYYEQWALGFDAGYAHVGGSPEALADLKTWGVRDLDQFYNGGSYHRISTRAAPHNVYTSITTLNQLETSKGYSSSAFIGFPRKAEAAAKVPTTSTINLSLSGPVYNVSYSYNAKTNSYDRSEGGAPHIDANSNTQISPKVVIALVMPYSLEADGYHSDYTTIGSGPVDIFQDGLITTGQWSKSSNTSQFIFTDANGTPIKLNAGQTWLTAVAKGSNITSTP